MKEYLWKQYYEGNYVLEEIEKTDTRSVCHEVNYPIKEDKNGWFFFTAIHDANEDYQTEGWHLTEEEQEEIKDYIRNVLKPSDLYEESEVKNMENRIAFVIPKDKQDSVRTVLRCMLGEDYLEDDMIYDEYEAVIAERDDLAKSLRDMEGKINSNALQELEVCKADKEILANELRQANFRADENKRVLGDLLDDVTMCIQSICDDMQNTLDRYAFKEFMKKFTDEQIVTYGLEKHIEEEKYRVTRVRVTKEIQTDILVLEKDDENADAELVLDGAVSSEISPYFDDNNDYEEYSFEEREVVAEDCTKDEILNRYSQEELFCDSDCEDVWE